MTVESLRNYFLPAQLNRDSLIFFSVDPIRPEKAKSAEIGYRTTINDKIYIDANYYYSKYTDFIGYKVGVKFNTLQDDTSTGAYEISLPSIQKLQNGQFSKYCNHSRSFIWFKLLHFSSIYIKWKL